MLLIKNGTIVDPVKLQEVQADIFIQDGRIKRIDKELDEKKLAEEFSACGKKQGGEEENMQVLDASGRKIGPGLVDVHVHFRDPGFTYKEDILTGAKAAAKGGFTTVVLMANTKPSVDNEETLSYILKKGKETNIHVETCGTVTKGLKGRELTDMEGLKAAGAVGFTDDGIPLMDQELLEKAMVTAKELAVPISLHEENPSYIENNGVNAGEAAAHFGIGGSSSKAEISLIERDVALALKTGVSLNVQHISTKEGVAIVRKAKEQGSNIHAEATPHHFTLTEEAVIKKGTLAKMNPPLRKEEDRLAIVEGLKDGTIDLIATDHAPHAKEEKDKPLTEAPSGIIGLETAFGLAVANLVAPGHLTLPGLFEKMSLNPARLYHLSAGTIEEGAVADLIIFDDKKQYIFKEEDICSKSHNTPFIGETLQGKIYFTIAGGTIAYRAE
ncbi:MAG: dihydroorotase [Roseburia sp.]|nr:dihydroorotase [Roseburia sp.]MCM1279732.1 dihydroorotase [Robinsoniella sp.]